MAESTQHKLDRIRPPRVQITYDVETRGSFVKMELPFVVGIMADLSSAEGVKDKDGKPVPLRDRKYMEIDRDNFNDIMAFTQPSVALNGGSAKYTFESLEDFSPIRLLKPTNEKLNTVDPADTSALGKARADYDRRTKLSDMVAKLDGNVPLQKKFLAALQKNNGQELKEKVLKIKREAGMDRAAGITSTSPELMAAQQAVEKARQGIEEAKSALDAKNKLDPAKTKVESANDKVSSLKTPPEPSPEEKKLIDAQGKLTTAQETLSAQQAVEDARKSIREAQSALDAKNKLDQAKTKFESANAKVSSLKAPPEPSPEEKKLSKANEELKTAQEKLTLAEAKLAKDKQIADAEAAAQAAETAKNELEKPATNPEKVG